MILVECKLSQNRRILSIYMIIFLFVVVVGNSTNTKKPLYYNGNKVHLICGYEKPISGCRFIVPGEILEIQLFENRKINKEKYEYFGNGFEAGECGITIKNATSANEGYARCILTVNNSFELYETVEVKIFDFNNLHIGLPKMKILNSGPLKVSQTLAAECVTKSTDQYANISWLLNDRILNNSNTHTIKRFERDKGTIFELKSILKHQLSTLDNGSILKCRTRLSNNSQEFVDTTFELVVLNETRILDPKVGLPFDVSINFFAFPRVLSSRWIVNKRIIYYGKATNEFLSKELKYLGNNQWNAILHITNITDLNIHYNYSLQVNDSAGTKHYNVRLDESINETDLLNDEKSTQREEETTTEITTTTASLQSINISENSITSSPKLEHFTIQQQQQNEKPNTFRRTTLSYSNPNGNDTIHSFSTERRTKYTRKQQKNTSISITEMTSVTSTSTTTESNMIVTMTKEQYTKKNETKAAVSEKSLEKTNDNEENTTLMNVDENEIKENELITTTSKNVIEIFTIEDSNSNETKRFEVEVERFFIRMSFVTMILIIIIFILMVCHYRHQVTVLKTEIIQMNLENYYNQSCLYPSRFNNYSPTNFQQIDGVPIYIKRPLNVNSNNNNNSSSSGDSETSSNQFLSTYNTNSHLYQSIDADDIDNHVYDEIVHAKENDEEKPNNYENNESFNNVNEMLIPSHCHMLMTIHEEEEQYEASQAQKLSNLESTYI